LWGTHRVIPPNEEKPRRFRTPVVAVVGDPVPVGSDANPREATDRIMGAICAVVAEARRQYPPAPAADADAWWARRPETARLRSCRGRIAQEQLDAAYEAQGPR